MTRIQMKRRLYANYSRFKSVPRSWYIKYVADFLAIEGTDDESMDYTNDADLLNSFYWCCIA